MAALWESFEDKDSGQAGRPSYPENVMNCKGNTIVCTPSFNNQEAFTALSFPRSHPASLPCLPVSKGSIKKTAQTRSVNSSPRSYRLMPASSESSDKMSFVEKFPNSHYFPMKFMLEVAELWEVSKRSELECNFTLAKSDVLSESDNYMNEAKNRSPICHSSVLPSRICKVKHSRQHKMDIVEEISKAGLGRDLFSQVKHFLKAQELKERHPMGIAGLIKMEFRPSNAHQSEFVIEQSSTVHSEAVSPAYEYLKSTPWGNFPLTPLVNRLSMTELEEVSNCKGTTCTTSRPISPLQSEQFGISKKQFISSKRSKSKRLHDREEEPLQKRAYCDHIQQV